MARQKQLTKSQLIQVLLIRMSISGLMGDDVAYQRDFKRMAALLRRPVPTPKKSRNSGRTKGPLSPGISSRASAGRAGGRAGGGKHA